MLNYDFEYDGKYLSDFGFIICDFTNGGLDNDDNCAKIVFDKVSMDGGRRYSLAATRYESCVEGSMTICKNPDIYEDLSITDYEFKDISRWLSRRGFHKFRVIGKYGCSYAPYYFNASFNVQRVILDGKTVGIEIGIETDSAFAYGDKFVSVIDVINKTSEYKVSNVSDDEGIIIPDMKITCHESGNLRITNKTSGTDTIINGCSEGEVIYIYGDSMIIKSSDNSHNISKDFNFVFMALENEYGNTRNVITASLFCEIEVSYTPLVRDVPIIPNMGEYDSNYTKSGCCSDGYYPPAQNVIYATLDNNGKLNANQVPDGLDDVIDGYMYNGVFYKDSEHKTSIVGQFDVLYVDKSENNIYRYDGKQFVKITSGGGEPIKPIPDEDIKHIWDEN